ncbi:MAG TPA: hypothetical protein VFU27_03145, partial [Terriglobales bacterium]|nr:hypothetical protein [Terriglobales bacterium]
MKSWQSMTRREWLSTAGLAGAALAGQHLFGGSAPSLSLSQDAAAPAPVADKIAPRLQPFPMKQVRLRPGIFQQQLEFNRAYLHLLPNDRLAHMFRVTAGLPSSA